MAKTVIHQFIPEYKQFRPWNQTTSDEATKRCVHTVGNRQVYFERDDLGFPDGSCIDDAGCLWNARFSAGKLLRITPQGKIDREIDLPVTNPTSCTFGGTDGRTLFVTSARFTLSDEALAQNPQEGAVLALDVGVSGPADRRFVPGST